MWLVCNGNKVIKETFYTVPLFLYIWVEVPYPGKFFLFLILVFPGTYWTTFTDKYSNLKFTTQHIKLLHVIQSLQAHLSKWQPPQGWPQAFLVCIQLQKVSMVRTAQEHSYSLKKIKAGITTWGQKTKYSHSCSKHTLVHVLWHGLVSHKAKFSSGNYLPCRIYYMSCMMCPAILVSMHLVHLPVLSSLIRDVLL